MDGWIDKWMSLSFCLSRFRSALLYGGRGRWLAILCYYTMSCYAMLCDV